MTKLFNFVCVVVFTCAINDQEFEEGTKAQEYELENSIDSFLFRSQHVKDTESTSFSHITAGTPTMVDCCVVPAWGIYIDLIFELIAETPYACVQRRGCAGMCGLNALRPAPPQVMFSSGRSAPLSKEYLLTIHSFLVTCSVCFTFGSVAHATSCVPTITTAVPTSQCIVDLLAKVFHAYMR